MITNIFRLLNLFVAVLPEHTYVFRVQFAAVSYVFSSMWLPENKLRSLGLQQAPLPDEQSYPLTHFFFYLVF